MKIILFVCGHNAGRSQIAQAYFNYINDNPQYIAFSAGTHPAKTINPVVKEILEKNGIPTKDLSPTLITPEIEKNAEKIFTMGCGVDCTIFSAPKEVIDLGISDPHGKSEKEVLKIYHELTTIISTLQKQL